MSFKNNIAAIGLCFGISLMMSQSLLAAEQLTAGSFMESIQGGNPLVQFRGRYEQVDQEGKPENAHAFTLRSMIGWQTLPFNHVSITAQLVDVTQLNSQFYDNDKGRGLASPYPTVPDPQITDINQLYVEYDGVPKTRVRLGRQIVQLDNTRFVGDVAFRQVPQVFDGISFINTSIPQLELMAAHFERLRQTNTQLRDTNLEIVHAAYRYSPTGSLAGYGYFQDQPVTGQRTGFTDNSNQTLGLRLDGGYVVDPVWKVLYTAEYAKQDSYESGDSLIDAHYSRLGGGVAYKAWYLRIDQEVLSSNQGLYGFQTPLATLHPFQGWADYFATTPAEGIRDSYLSAGSKLYEVQLSAEWHQFNSDVDFVTPTGRGSRYGHELDLGASFALSKRLISKLEYANFREDDIADSRNAANVRNRDIEKFWLTLVYNY